MILFDIRLWHRFCAIALPYWVGDEKWQGRGLLVLGQTGFAVLFNQSTGEFTSALAALVAFLIVYAIVGTVVTLRVFGKVLIGLNFYQLKREADFRFSLVRIRENAEGIALLDEATSAMDVRNEDRLYQQLAVSGTTLVSTSHRPSILKYHAQVLELGNDEGWRLYAVRDYLFDHDQSHCSE